MRLFILGTALGTLLAWVFRQRLLALGRRGVEPIARVAEGARESVAELGDRRPLEDLTKEELYERAKAAAVPGRSTMSKEQLIEALRASS